MLAISIMTFRLMLALALEFVSGGVGLIPCGVGQIAGGVGLVADGVGPTEKSAIGCIVGIVMFIEIPESIYDAHRCK